MKKKVFIIEDGGINSHFKRGQLCNAGAVIGKDYEKKKIFSRKYKFYDYYKDEIKELRKMGHYTVRS